MGHGQIRRHCTLDAKLGRFFDQSVERLCLSARAHDRILKVARTIADLAASDHIGDAHLMEAIRYRSLDRALFR
jgi:magnesium chelatase family protein